MDPANVIHNGKEGCTLLYLVWKNKVWQFLSRCQVGHQISGDGVVYTCCKSGVLLLLNINIVFHTFIQSFCFFSDHLFRLPSICGASFVLCSKPLTP